MNATITVLGSHYNLVENYLLFSSLALAMSCHTRPEVSPFCEQNRDSRAAQIAVDGTASHNALFYQDDRDRTFRSDKMEPSKVNYIHAFNAAA